MRRTVVFIDNNGSHALWAFDSPEAAAACCRAWGAKAQMVTRAQARRLLLSEEPYHLMRGNVFLRKHAPTAAEFADAARRGVADLPEGASRSPSFV